MPLTSDPPAGSAVAGTPAPQRAGPPEADDPSALKVVPVRHPWRWAAIAETVRAGVLAVDGGQSEAAAALGIPRLRRLRRIVLPQAMRAILPNAGNEVISLFKGTSIVSVTAIGELFYQVQVVYGRNGRVVPLLMVATAWYILLTTVLSALQYYVERHYAKGAGR
ncbi:hypothetical protein GCM10010211_58920 [Streptomyces albospinus]|uniref:ABC transmembrane type-1 domain-containing protein n=1 Tax=Streptomyces albospinus TaxID=285515 RepID=A0ABQ2VHS4_9ACTN|nr:ABC transporter permease subunit [Streptomyces albospinus]GGU85075.1 hypothetical protein GCM10010211_58920 [Streptomyces albospinus]